MQMKRLAAPLKIVLAIVLLQVAVQPTQAVITDGLISYWPMESVADGATPDVIGDNDLTLVGSPAGVAGQKGSAFQFDGAATYLTNLHATEPTATTLPVYRTGGYTVAMWVKGVPQTAKYLLAEGSTTSNNPLFIIQTGQAAANNDRLDVIIRTLGGATPVNLLVSSSVVFDDTWHHIAWVDLDGQVQLYVDGVLDATSFTYAPVGAIPFDTTAIGTLVRALISTGAIFNGAI